jgi:hypothetical protein
MNKKDLIVKVLEEMGFKPYVDEDGDVGFRFQMKTIFAIIGKESDNYLVLNMPQFYDIEDGDEAIALTTCNKITRELKLMKVFVDQNFKTISANSEFFYADEDSLVKNIEYSLEILSVVRRLYLQTFEDMKQ